MTGLVSSLLKIFPRQIRGNGLRLKGKLFNSLECLHTPGPASARPDGNNLKKRYSVTCPISYRSSDDPDRDKRMILEYICPGYQTCNSPKLYCMSTQTLICMADWDNQHFKGTKFRVPSIENIADSDEFRDAIESGDEEFFSVTDETMEEKMPYAPHSINIKLKESPHIIMKDGTRKTSISLTNNYIDKNGLELVIEEGPSRNVKLKSGKKDIYPRENVNSNDVIISVTDKSQESNSKRDISFRKTKSGKELECYPDEQQDDLYPCEDLTMALRNLALDIVEQQRKEKSMREKLVLPGAKHILRSPKEHFPPTYKTIKDRHKSDTLKPSMPDKDPATSANPNQAKKHQNDNYKLKKFEWTALEGDPTENYTLPTKEESRKSIEVQTDVHINPNYTSEEMTFTTEGSDSLFKKSTLHAAEPLPFTVDPSNEKATAITQEATIAQIESDLSIKTEPTLEGIPELTEKTVSSEEVSNVELEREEPMIDIRKQEEICVTEDEETDISENLIPGRKLQTTKSASSIGMRSKLTDTEDLDDAKNNEVAIVSNKHITSPSLLKALQDFEEELSPLKTELSRLHMEFKTLDIPVEFKQETPPVAVDRGQHSAYFTALPPGSSQASSTYQPVYDPIYDFYRSHGVFPPQQPSIRREPCSCPYGKCLGLQRSSGFDCQRIRRLSPQALPSEFQREFMRPYWDGHNVFHPNSIWSEPEDILGGPSEKREGPPTENSDRNDNKSDKFYLFVLVLHFYLIKIVCS